ncbi:MAG: hypothetical protein R3B89_31450 [Polyangiaceae bacterium]
MTRRGHGSRIGRWIGILGLGVALGGCGPAKEDPAPGVSKEQIASCAENCEHLAAAEKPTCEKPVLEPQTCIKAVEFAEQDCKALCRPGVQPPPQ